MIVSVAVPSKIGIYPRGTPGFEMLVLALQIFRFGLGGFVLFYSVCKASNSSETFGKAVEILEIRFNL